MINDKRLIYFNFIGSIFNLASISRNFLRIENRKKFSSYERNGI